MSTATIRPMREADVAAADRVVRLAFGTYFGLPDPMSFRGDDGIIVPRLLSYPDGGFVAERDGHIVGTCIASNWGSIGVLGPVAVHPDLWKQGIARQLVGASLDAFQRWRCRMAGLFTFPQSASHIRLYQEFGFWPRHLVSVMQKEVTATEDVPGALSLRGNPARRVALVAACQSLAGSIYDGLDLRREIEGVLRDGMGDVVLVQEDGAMAGFAICHHGAGSEGGSKGCYIKFGLVRQGVHAPQRLRQLIAACEAYARRVGVTQISAGGNTGRHGAYRVLVELGFRTRLQGVAMHRPWQDGYDRPEVFALDDWR
jgi:GNAT superfamily N-acetyltransferase